MWLLLFGYCCFCCSACERPAVSAGLRFRPKSSQSVIQVLNSFSPTDSLQIFHSSMSSELNGQRSFLRRSFACVFTTRTNFCFRRPFHLHLVDLSGSSQLADEEEGKLFGCILEEKFPPRHFSECPSGCRKKKVIVLPLCQFPCRCAAQLTAVLAAEIEG